VRGTRAHRTVPKPWSDWETDQLAEMIADGWTFGGAARKLNRTRNSCIGRWHNHVIPAVGGQAV
jgi:hypothetical protein